MNEILRRALLAAHLDEVDIATRLEVDPKTVRRWLEGRLPYTRHRWALADLLNLNETDLWPELQAGRSRPDELLHVYPHRSAIPSKTWQSFFNSAEHEIDVLDDDVLFLAETTGILNIFVEKASNGIRVRIALAQTEATWHGEPTAVRSADALAEYKALLNLDNIELRRHGSVLYNSIFRSDNYILCCQRAYGISATRSPVMHLRCNNDGGLISTYLGSFERIWVEAQHLSRL